MQKIIIRKRTVFIFLTLAGLLAYSNSFRVPFHYDDLAFIRENAAIKSFSLFFQWLSDGSWAVFLNRAFLLFTFLINYVLHGFDTFGYHLFNLSFHIATAFLLYLLLSNYVDNSPDDPSHVKSIVASTLFVLHPIATESVTYISSRSSVLSTLFMLSTMLFFFSATSKEFRPFRYCFSILSFLLGLSTKQAAVVTPLLMVLFDWHFVSGTALSVRKRWKYYVPFLLIVLAGSVYYMQIVLHPEMHDRSWSTHVLTELKVFVEYLRLLVLPFGLTIDHDIKESISFDVPAAFALAILIGLMAAAFLAFKRNKVVSFSILWFLLSVAPFLALRLSDYMAERWIYSASIGFALILAETTMIAVEYRKKAAMAAIIGLALFFGALTFSRNAVYQDAVTLWADAAQKAPAKAKPYSNLCASYLEMMQLDKAIETCKTAIRLDSPFDETYINLSTAYFSKGDLDKAKKILQLLGSEGALELYHYNTAVVHASAGEHRKAIDDYRRVLEYRPRSPSALAGMAWCYRQLGNKTEAEKYYHLAVQGLPQNSEDFLMLAESYFQLGEKEKGRESLSKALTTEPLNLRVRNVIATTYYEQNNYDEAYRHFSIMAKISPGLAMAYEGMGRAMIAKGDYKEAGKQLAKALSLSSPGSQTRQDAEALLRKIGR